MDTVSMHKGYSVPDVVTGKPLAIGGSAGRADATGQGVLWPQLTPPLAPPKGTPTRAHFQVIHIASARTSSRSV